MKIVISIFSLPYEIDDLEKTLNQLKIASNYISNKTEWVLDVSMSLSDELVNWKKSSIPKQYFVDKFIRIDSKYMKNIGSVLPEMSKLLIHKRAVSFNNTTDYIKLEGDGEEGKSFCDKCSVL